MKRGYLSQYFFGVAAKTLSAVEAETLYSNQHEFNGVKALKSLLGEPQNEVRYSARFLYLTDYSDEALIEDGFLTWYDARQKGRVERGVMRSEYRLYFPTNRVSQNATAGDLLVIAKQENGGLLAIIAEKDTTIADQIKWLFGFSDLSHPGFSVREELETEQDRLAFATRSILESIGIFTDSETADYIQTMLERFGPQFPSSRDFSSFARSVAQVDPRDGPDEAMIAWMDREEILFRTLEKHIVAEKLSAGFSGDVDDFMSFSLSVQNRRKSRAGLALENHVEALLIALSIPYARTPRTEGTSKPDFIFPSADAYHNPRFDSDHLTMLAVKSSCKDRWRQVLAEADRIAEKHLLTLEPAISRQQTDEMASKRLQLVVPRPLLASYSEQQRVWLMDLAGFVEFVRERGRARSPI